MTHSPILDYQQTLDFLHGRINYERMSGPLASADFKLDRMRNLLGHLGDPHLKTRVVHVAGTKGKGTTATIVSGILQAAGYRVGLFTSPHLVNYEERIRINSIPISQTDLVNLTNQVSIAVATIDEQDPRLCPTFFEITTALAWLQFERQQVDIAVLEVGLGGRLDSTNLCLPEVCVITTISKDHTEVLGNKLTQIAAEKAGIIKPSVPIVCGVTDTEAQATIEVIATKNQSNMVQLDRNFRYEIKVATLETTSFVFHGIQQSAKEPSDVAASPDKLTSARDSDRSVGKSIEIELPLVGRHQAHNAACAVAAIQELAAIGWKTSSDAIQAGCRKIQWPARVEVLNKRPLVILDAAHNPVSVDALLKTLDEHQVAGKRTLIYSSTKDKPVEQLLSMLLPKFDSVILTEFRSNPRALPLDELNRIAVNLNVCDIQAIEQPIAAWETAFNSSAPDELICIAGSFFLAADLRPQLIQQFRNPGSKTP